MLLLSTEAEVGSRIRGMGAGADEYVGKPYDMAQVVARARALVLIKPRFKTPRSNAAIVQRRVLVIDDSATFRNELAEALEGAHFDVYQASTGEEGLSIAAALRPDAVIVDGVLPGIDGATVVRRLKTDAASRNTPCLLLTAAREAADEVRSFEAGADAYVRKSDDFGLILVRLTALLRGATPLASTEGASLFAPKRLLAVDDNDSYLYELGQQLRQEGYDVVLTKSGEEALQFLAAQTVDCILLDAVLPGLSGLEVCRRIKDTPAWRDTPLVILTATDGRDAMIAGMNAGADDYIVKSADFDVLKARLRAQLRRKYFEDENRRVREQLVREETEKRFQRLLHSNIIGAIQSDLNGHLVEANDAFLAMLGYSRQEFAAGALHNAGLTPVEWIERDIKAMEQLRQSGSATPFEKEMLRKDGSRLPIVLGLVLLEGTNTTVGFVLDRTEQKKAEQEIQKYAAALEHSNRELESFSYSVAHDLRAPLRSIDGFSRAIAEDFTDKLDEQGLQYLGYIRDAATRMSDLIDDLLTLSRVMSGDVHREDVNISEIALASLKRLQKDNPGRHVAIDFQHDLWVTGDARLLGVLFDNLLGNAWKFTSKVDVGLIEFGATEIDGVRTFYVRDNGAGFDMAFSNKLFGVFQRLHMASEFEGTGIGLATVNRIVHRHNGRVWAKGAMNAGATFYFTLDDVRGT